MRARSKPGSRRRARPKPRRVPGQSLPHPSESPRTRDRILRVAGEVFGERGFKAATVREICRLAGASVAAVNYHFRDKESLYLTVLTDLLETGLKKHPADPGLSQQATPQERLHAFVRAVLFRLLGEEGWYGQKGRGRLLAREITDPTPIMDRVIDTYMRPQKEILLSILRGLLGPDASEQDIQRSALSVMGQCLYYAFAQPIITRLGLAQGSDAESLDRLARHIWSFSLGGLSMVAGRRVDSGTSWR